jgi:high-affinity Fe2+/Pb2+ permease
MPESKSRKKRSSQRYNLHPQRKQRTKSSPGWFAPVMVALMIIGIGIIVWNFFRNDGQSFNPGVMWLGLGVLAAGFFGISFWR